MSKGPKTSRPTKSPRRLQPPGSPAKSRATTSIKPPQGWRVLNVSPIKAGPLASHRGEQSEFEAKDLISIQSALQDVRAATNPMMRRLAAIAEDVAPDELAPTPEARGALLEVVGFLLEVRTLLGIEAPLPHLSSLGGGDLECAWMRSERNLFLSIGPSGERVLQRVHLNNAEAKTLKRIESPDKIALLDAVLWVMGHGEAE